MSQQPTLDRCPGVLRPFAAADGNIVRLRQPGGRLSTDQLRRLALAAQDFGAPFVQLTSRGNVQIRALADPLPAGFLDVVNGLGLLPSATHERVRNIVAAPAVELDHLVEALDSGLQRRPSLADLPGRWMFALSDRSGACLDLPYDVAYQRISSTDGYVHLGGRRFTCPPDQASETLLDLAQHFLDTRPDAGVWNVRSLPEDSAFFARVPDDKGKARDQHTGGRNTGGSNTEGHAPGTDENTTLGVPLSLLTVEQTHLLADLVGHVVVTPYRTLVLRNIRLTSADRKRVIDVGLELGGATSSRITACIGAPYCRRTNSPTLALTRGALPLTEPSSPRTHVVGCDRACGAPASPHVLVTAPESVDDILTAIGPHD